MIDRATTDTSRLLMWLVLGLLACASAATQGQPVPCSQVPAPEREQARRASACVDTAPRVVLPSARTLQRPALPSAPASTLAAAAPASPKVLRDLQVQPAQPLARDDVGGLRSGEIVYIPALVGRRFNEAARQLQGVAAAVREPRPSSRPADEVINQFPRDARVPRPARVRLVASDGSLVAVPALRSLPAAAALVRLQRLGLRAEVSERRVREEPGTVINQQPDAGAEVPRGSAVSVVVESAPRTVWVRNYVGAPVSLAAPELAQLGLNSPVVWRPSSRPGGEVIDRSPRETEVALGSTVTLVGCDGSLVLVPQLQGDRADAATAKLGAAGL